MKKIFWVLTILFAVNNAHALEADFTTYLRGGTGISQEGGKMECFRNKNLPGNFLRLGNECDFYTELGFVFHHKKADEADPSFFRTQLRYAYSSDGLRQWESSKSTQTIDTSGANATVTTTIPKSEIEAYVKAGGFEGNPIEYWIGKRFYRDVDLFIFDWYYYGEMAGVGAGVEAIPVGPGKLAIANLIQANEDFATTSIGRPVLNIWDFRYSTIPVFAEQNISFWGVYAWAKESTQGTKTFEATNGYVLATKLEGKGLGGYNKAVLEFGQGAMKDFNVYGNSAVDSSQASQRAQNKAWNVRLVEDWSMDVVDRWAFMAGFAASYGSNGLDQDNVVQWQGVGVRPVYYFTDRFQLATEVGYTRYEDQNEKDAGGGYVGPRDMGRVAIAPQLSFKKSIWGRPVMRAYASYSFWNTANQGASYIGNSAPTFADKSSGFNVGYQYEVWF
ncbi:carbohydrate porin [Bdellovibrio sp. KM01]|uniref:carbohydrate porin n=1 Tax=Bdellovibrio sp. KM01 TaxID=2748865 RepID=UPI0021078541|nr:carbohydrate porin [Bdellovibrio sp. KM01]